MATQILATGTTAANSSDTVIAAGTAVCLKGLAGPGATVNILLKDDAGNYNFVGELTSAEPVAVITAAGTYRFTRIVGVACGVFSG